MDYCKIVQDVIQKHKDEPIDMLGIGDDEGEYNYLTSHKDSYVRTVRDIDNLYKNRRKNTKILEIGSFLGPVSISLKKMGYAAHALDIPEFYQSASLKALYKNNDVPFAGLNLKNNKLPYESDSFDAIIICEVMEHLNFNPLPIMQEMNRILKKGGHLYIGMPNQSHILNRIKLLFGESIHNPIDDFFYQLDHSVNMIVGLHWREYTLNETIYMIEKMGFKSIKAYYFIEKVRTSLIFSIMKTLLYLIPSFRPYQVVIGKKLTKPVHNFWQTDANS